MSPVNHNYQRFHQNCKKFITKKKLKAYFYIKRKLLGTLSSFFLDFCFLLFAQIIRMIVNTINMIPPTIPATTPIFRDDDEFGSLSRIDFWIVKT